ncbi:MAG: hypothetical protein GXP38_08255, partial [Chloroflexi bacterium]|nr:hypothetical protein [Chloroflexota bacterium]
MSSASLDIRALLPRIHTTPDLLARSSGRVTSRYDTPMAAINALLLELSLLPVPLLHTWLQHPRGHIVINLQHHGYKPGIQPVASRTLQDVAWIKLAYSLSDPILYLTPVGALISQLLGWKKPDSAAILKNWTSFCRGIESCFRAEYGRSEAAREDIDCYLAEGIAAYLVDRRKLNIQD